MVLELTYLRSQSKKSQPLKASRPLFTFLKVASLLKPLCLKISRWLEAICLLGQNTGTILRGGGGPENFHEAGSPAHGGQAPAFSPTLTCLSGFLQNTPAALPPFFGSLQLFPACGHLSSSPKLLPSPQALGNWLVCASATTGLASDSGARYLTPKATWRRSLIHRVQRMPGLWPPTNKAFPTEQRQLTREQTRSKKES